MTQPQDQQAQEKLTLQPADPDDPGSIRTVVVRKGGGEETRPQPDRPETNRP